MAKINLCLPAKVIMNSMIPQKGRNSLVLALKNLNKTKHLTTIVYVGHSVFHASDFCLSIGNTGLVAAVSGTAVSLCILW